MDKENKIPWTEGLIIVLYIPFIKSEPKYFLVAEIVKEWIILVFMTSIDKRENKEGANPNQYIIIHENQNSEYYGKIINYNAIVVISVSIMTWQEFVKDITKEKE